MDVWIEWVYRSNATKKTTTFSSGMMPAEEALLFSKDIEKTGRVHTLEFVDDKGSRWTKKEMEKLLKEIETEPHNIVAYFDGGYHRELQAAGLGVVIYFKQNGKPFRIRKNEAMQYIESNNEAEYAAFWLLLRELEDLGVRSQQVEFIGDSQVVLNQLSGDWPAYEDKENRWLDRIEDKMKELRITPLYRPVSRGENREADQLAGQALKGEFISSRKQVGEVERD
jgi:ribonuclease HI